MIGAGIGSMGSAAVSASMSGTASTSASGAGGSAIPALVDQVQFLTLIGQVGGNARPLDSTANSTANSAMPTKDKAEIAAFRSNLLLLSTWFGRHACISCN